MFKIVIFLTIYGKQQETLICIVLYYLFNSQNVKMSYQIIMTICLSDRKSNILNMLKFSYELS